MPSQIVNCAVIGAGLLGMRHAEFLAGSKNARLVAVADLRPAVAEQAAQRTGATAYTDHEAMLAKEKLDLVLVETPDNLHRIAAVAACNAGIPNLVIQKPLATTVEDGAAILAAAVAAGTRVFVWYENRAFGTDMATQYAIRAGLIGKVVYGDCDTDNALYTPLRMWGERSRDWVASSSPANFLASHTLDRLFWYFAPARVASVFAISQREVLGYTPDLYDVFLSFESGLKVRVKVGWIHHIEGKIESAELFNGTEGTIYNNRHPRFNTFPGWRLNVRDRSLEVLRHHQEVLHKRGLGSRVIGNDLIATGWGESGPLGLEIPAVEAPKHELLGFILDAILEGTDSPRSWRDWQGDLPLVTGETALENVRVITAIEKSVAEGQPATIDRG